MRAAIAASISGKRSAVVTRSTWSLNELDGPVVENVNAAELKHSM